jgi:hypothetical protein
MCVVFVHAAKMLNGVVVASQSSPDHCPVICLSFHISSRLPNLDSECESRNTRLATKKQSYSSLHIVSHPINLNT